MDSPDRIFRQAALDRLSSPEQLDQLMQVATPKSWMALLAFGVLLLMALFWGIFGEIPTRVMGRGIFLKSEGVFVVTARGEGNVLDLLVQAGDTVTNGQLLAVVTQRELEIKLHQAETNLSGSDASLKDLLKSQQREQAFELEDLSAQRLMFQRMISNYHAQIVALQDRTNAEHELLDKGIVSAPQFLETKNQLYAAQYDLSHAEVQLQQLDFVRFQAEARRKQLQLDREDQVQQAKNQVEYLSSMYTLNTEVRSPYQGEVLEVRVKPGDLLAANTPIATLQSATNNLEARLYLSAADGKLLDSESPRRRGKASLRPASPRAVSAPMEVLLSPVSVKKEEYGLMQGTVKEVGKYPVTPQGMLRILGNPTLVTEFSQMGASIEVTVRLAKTPYTRSGYLWTTKDGPPLPITSGTLCDGTITIAHQSPISLVLPFLKSETKN